MILNLTILIITNISHPEGYINIYLESIEMDIPLKHTS
jgi:hypothetical protein